MRVVSLCPSLTETLFEIGAGGDVVGATRFCVRPARALRQVPRVGGTKDPDVDAIRRLAPDIVFVNSEENRREDIEVLGREFRVHTSLPRRVLDVPPLVRDLGSIVGRPREAEALAAAIEASSALLVSNQSRPSFSFAYFIWKDPWMVVSGDTYVSDLLGYAGGRNVFEKSSDRYPAVTPDDVGRARPEVLFFSSEPYPFRERHRDEIAAAFGSATGVSFISGDDCCWHGARTREGLALMGRLSPAISR